MPKVSYPSVSSKRSPGKKPPSVVYRVGNWSAYNQALKQRGSLTVWFSTEAVAAWSYQGPPQRGAQFQYSDLAIETALTLRLIYHLSLRQTRPKALSSRCWP